LSMSNSDNSDYLNEIAIIGMAGRFPGARDTEEFWQNLRDGKESVSFFSDEELVLGGIDPGLLNDDRYVRAGAPLQRAEMFDAAFFGFTPREAEITDPQHRVFLECAWEALESAGYNSETYKKHIGVYAGAGTNDYVLNIYSDPALVAAVGELNLVIGNDKDHLSTRVSYKLNLRGPSVNIQTACSTSLVAVHLACQALLDYECDLALAGGVSISCYQKTGYLHQEGSILSSDGH